jgi:hypothetical protein
MHKGKIINEKESEWINKSDRVEQVTGNAMAWTKARYSKPAGQQFTNDMKCATKQRNWRTSVIRLESAHGTVCHIRLATCRSGHLQV